MIIYYHYFLINRTIFISLTFFALLVMIIVQWKCIQFGINKHIISEVYLTKRNVRLSYIIAYKIANYLIALINLTLQKTNIYI